MLDAQTVVRWFGEKMMKDRPKGKLSICGTGGSMSEEKRTYNPYCLVSYFHYEATNKVLYCKDCIFQDCECKKVRAV